MCVCVFILSIANVFPHWRTRVYKFSLSIHMVGRAGVDCWTRHRKTHPTVSTLKIYDKRTPNNYALL